MDKSRLLVSFVLWSIVSLTGCEGRQVIEGSATAARNDASSTVACPSGTVPVDCQCSSWVHCDGAYFTADRECKAHAARTTPIKPVVTCEPEYTRVYYKSTGYERLPEVTCDDGSILIGCSIYSPWKATTNSPKIRENTCTSMESMSSAGLKAFAICRALRDPTPILQLKVRDIQVVVGPATAAVDDATSSVGCPAGTVLVDCQCHDWEICDGTYVTDDHKCTARASAKRVPVKPVAGCAPEYTRVYYKSNGRADLPQVTCDPGSTLIGCTLYSPWRSPSTLPIADGNTCKSSQSNSGTTAIAICRDHSEECVSGEGETFPYGSCSVTCGGGEKSRIYYCTVASTGIRRFIHETVVCGDAPC